jgi:broad specificity phosphatase PhoE
LYSDVVKHPAAAALVVALLAAVRPAAAQEAVYIVRHAERADQTADPPLSTEGVGRSYKLRDLLKDAGITRIFTSTLQRTIDTAKPLADEIHVAATPVPDAALAARISEARAADRVLVVGHSNTIPPLLRALGVDAPITIGDTEYDNLFIVVPRKDGRPVLLRLKF